MDTNVKTEGRAAPWNKGKLLGQKPPLKLEEIWASGFGCNWQDRATVLPALILVNKRYLRSLYRVLDLILDTQHQCACFANRLDRMPR